jgi:RNA polymerase sigma-70 factor (ECF subfamily)
MTAPPDEGFEELYQAHSGRLVVQLYVLTQDLHLAEDVVHEAFCRALARWSRISGYDDPIGWVRRVAWNLATTHWRQARRVRDLVRRHRPEVSAGPGPERLALVDAMAGLPMAQRRAVILHYLADMTVVEVARAEGTSPNAIKQRLHRARTTLAAQLVQPQPEVGNV